jgi:hypothetical protein
MDINLALTILGITITLILGIISIIMTIRRKNKGILDLIIQDDINLFNSIVKNINNLKLLYKDQPISENIHLIKLFLINKSEKDLSKEITEKFPTISFGNDSNILDVKIISKSTDLNAKIEILQNNIVVQSDLIQCDEYLYIESLVEINSNVDIEKLIEFKYRIADFIQNKPLCKRNLKDASKNLSILIGGLIGICIGSLLTNSPFEINQYDLSVRVSASGNCTKLDYFDYSYPSNHTITIPNEVLNKIKEKSKDISSEYTYFNFIFRSKDIEYDFDGYHVKYVYINYFTLTGIFSLNMTILIILWLNLKNRRQRRLFKFMETIIKD